MGVLRMSVWNEWSDADFGFYCETTEPKKTSLIEKAQCIVTAIPTGTHFRGFHHKSWSALTITLFLFSSAFSTCFFFFFFLVWWALHFYKYWSDKLKRKKQKKKPSDNQYFTRCFVLSWGKPKWCILMFRNSPVQFFFGGGGGFKKTQTGKFLQLVVHKDFCTSGAFYIGGGN